MKLLNRGAAFAAEPAVKRNSTAAFMAALVMMLLIFGLICGLMLKFFLL